MCFPLVCDCTQMLISLTGGRTCFSLLFPVVATGYSYYHEKWFIAADKVNCVVFFFSWTAWKSDLLICGLCISQWHCAWQPEACLLMLVRKQQQQHSAMPYESRWLCHSYFYPNSIYVVKKPRRSKIYSVFYDLKTSASDCGEKNNLVFNVFTPLVTTTKSVWGSSANW